MLPALPDGNASRAGPGTGYRGAMRLRHSRAVVTAVLAAAGPGLCASAAAGAYDPADPSQKAAYEHALDVGAQAYDYGIPLLSMDRLYRASTSITVPDGRGGGPVNRFNTFRALADASDRQSVAPNNDTLYTPAWVNLAPQPLVVHIGRAAKRFRYLELLSPYEENFANIGSPARALKGTDFLLTAPGWRGRVPRGLTRVRSPYARAWVLGRTYVRDRHDLPGARRTAATFLITPLSRWDRRHPTAFRPRPPRHRDTTLDPATIPGTQAGEDPLTFFDALNAQLRRFRPPAADRPLLATIAELGIGPGRARVSTSADLSDAQRAGLAAAVTGAAARLQGRLVGELLAGFDTHNGWLVFTGGGRYGTDYAIRAMVDRFGFGSPTPDVSVYPLAVTDRTRAPLTAANRYVVHFPAADARPPVQFFWSLTLYDADLYFVPNSIDRWVLNDRSGLKRNPDGSLDVYVQPQAPADPAQRANWLPAPPASADDPAFRLLIRLYGLSGRVLAGIADGTGWQPPTILPCDAGGTTSDGVACAG